MPLATPAAAATSLIVTAAHAALGEQLPRRVEHALAVARRVGPLGRAAARDGESAMRRHGINLTVVKLLLRLNLTAVKLEFVTMEALAIPFLLLVGALLAVQAGANVQLSAALGSPIGASALQLTIGAALLIALAALAGGLGAAALLDDVAAWHLVGGLGSAIYITAGILLFPRLGAVIDRRAVHHRPDARLAAARRHRPLGVERGAARRRRAPAPPPCSPASC